MTNGDYERLSTRSPIVTADLSCRGCGYNLRTLARVARCPECGLSVESSWRTDTLRHASPHWIRTLTRGALLLRVGFFVLFAMPFLQLIAHTMIPATALAMLLIIPGTVLITSPEPHRDCAPGRLLGILVRLMLGIANALACLWMVAPMLKLQTWGWPSAELDLTALAALAGFGTLPMLLMLHIGTLMSRVPDDINAARARAVARFIGCACALHIVAFLFERRTGIPLFVAGYPACLACVVVVFEPAVAILSIAVMVRAAEALRASADLAEQSVR